MRTVVVYVHGLWLNGWEAGLLRRRLCTALGAEARSFTYASVSASLKDNAGALGRFLGAVRADTLHLVAHSLGGLVVLKLFESRELKDAIDAIPPGRIVLLGSPARGSRSAQRFVRWPGGRKLLGRAGAPLLEFAPRAWNGKRPLGIIAGNLPYGLGRILGPMDEPNDGTVLVSETQLTGAADAITLRVSHSGLPFSANVAEHTARFLQQGLFTSTSRGREAR